MAGKAWWAGSAAVLAAQAALAAVLVARGGRESWEVRLQALPLSIVITISMSYSDEVLTDPMASSRCAHP
jgi:hypothetical protein